MGCKNKSEIQVKNEIEDLSLNAEIIDVGWSTGHECNCYSEYLFVKIILKNNSNIPKSFWIMKCSWQESFITDVDSIDFLPRDCLSNFPISKELRPNESITFTSIIKVPESVLKHNEFKIGFVMYSERVLMDHLMFDRKTRNKYIKSLKTYWSNSLSMKSKPIGFEENKE